ncbi:MAG: universal stress protein [Sphaerochaetaceae bacterium]|nr:universal stress protein [Sphaerochaetaceae bacterium]
MSNGFTELLVYLDGSEDSMSAAMAAIVLAKQLESHLTAIYVVNTKALQDLVKARIFLDVEQQEYQRDIEGDAVRYLSHVKKLGKKKGVAVECVKSEGAVHQVVRDYISANSIDMLVIGGLSGIHSRRDELLSETDRMMRNATIPVFVVRDNDDIWDMYESLPDTEREDTYDID